MPNREKELFKTGKQNNSTVKNKNKTISAGYVNPCKVVHKNRECVDGIKSGLGKYNGSKAKNMEAPEPIPVNEHYAKFGKIRIGLFGGSPKPVHNLASMNKKPKPQPPTCESESFSSDFGLSNKESIIVKSSISNLSESEKNASRVLEYDDLTDKDQVKATEVSLNSAAQNVADIEDMSVIQSFASSELSDIVSSPLETEVTEDYVLFSSDVVDYADSNDSMKNSFIQKTYEPTLTAVTTTAIDQSRSITTFATSVQKEITGNKVTYTLSKNNVDISKRTTDTVTTATTSWKAQATNVDKSSNFQHTNILASNLFAFKKKVAENAATTTASTQASSGLKPPTVLVTTNKMSPDVTQSTAKVSFGNTTISVPILKPMTHLIPADKHKTSRNVNISKSPTIFVRGQKISPTTIVSLSQVQIKPATNAKIVQAKVIGKKMQLPPHTISTSDGNITRHTFTYPKLSQISQDMFLPNKLFEDESTSPKSSSSTQSELDLEAREKTISLSGNKKIIIQKLSTNKDMIVQKVLPLKSETVSPPKAVAEKIEIQKQAMAARFSNIPQLSPLSKPTEMATNMANVSQQLRTIMSSLSTTKPELEKPKTESEQKESYDSRPEQVSDEKISSIICGTSNTPAVEEPIANQILGKEKEQEKQRERIQLQIKRSKSTDEGLIERKIPAQITTSKRLSLEMYNQNEENKTSVTTVTQSAVDKLPEDGPARGCFISTVKITPTPKSDETQNVLLKKLLQSSNSENSSNLMPQGMPGRKVPSLRAPSLGVVSTLEAQLARPVIPPVPANSPLLLSSPSSSKHNIPKQIYPPKSEPELKVTQIFSKETSFVSNPSAAPIEHRINTTPVPADADSRATPTDVAKVDKEAKEKQPLRVNTPLQAPQNPIAAEPNIGPVAVSASKPVSISDDRHMFMKNNSDTETIRHIISQSQPMAMPQISQLVPQVSKESEIQQISQNVKEEKNEKVEKVDESAPFDIKRKRKREHQKHKRQTLSKDPMHYKKKCRKLSHFEDYDGFIDNLMVQIRQMQSLQVMEPLLNRNYGICPIYGTGDLTGGKTQSDQLSGVYGHSIQDGMIDFYGMKPFGQGTPNEKHSDTIQNGFYDQEFSPLQVENEYNQINTMHAILKDRLIDSPEHIIPSPSPEFFNYCENTSVYPHIKLPNESRNVSGITSPTLPLISPVPIKSKFGFNILKSAKIVTNDSDKKKTKTEPNMTVTLTLTSLAAENIVEVLRSLANILHVPPPNSYRIIERTSTPPSQQLGLYKLKGKDSRSGPIDIQTILNGTAKFCRHCDVVILDAVITAKASEFPLLTSSDDLHFCSKACYKQFKWRPISIIDDAYTPNVEIKQKKDSVQSKMKNQTKSNQQIEELLDKDQKISRYKLYKRSEIGLITEVKKPSEKEITDTLYRMQITVAPPRNKMVDDTRQCIFCGHMGDGVSDGPSRLLNFDVDKWVHLNCALWSDGVYEMGNGGLKHLDEALRASLHQSCTLCHQLGATIKCFKNRCASIYHLSCALKDNCVFYKNKTINCAVHASKTEKENILTSLHVMRRVYVERDECRQVAAVMHHSELSNLIRVGSLIFLSVGQLLPHQLQAFHTPDYIYPIGYKIIRFYWSMNQPNKRCRYVCSIADIDGLAEFRILVQEAGYDDLEFKSDSPKAVWEKVLVSIVELRKKFGLVQLFPKYISGEDLFGLTEPAVVRILESLPGVETLTDYRFKYGRNPLLELPLAINPSGAARTEPKQRHAIGWKKPHTQRTGSVFQRLALPSQASIAGEVTCPYSKQFVHSKSSQYKKMKQEWRNNVYLARSKIQGLGLYAARDLEKHTMVIEYIGEVIRTEVSEIREKQYEARNRGIYMFRLDEDRVVDATLSGGLARYINHSCNPNCVTEIVEVDREVRIIIFAKRRILRGEELSYDYKFNIEDDAHKISCMCGAPNCRKWMN